MTGYVATRWYRAPEIMLNWMHYSQTGDGSPAGRGLRGWAGPEARGLGDRPGAQDQTFREAGHRGSWADSCPAQGAVRKGPGCDRGAVGPAPSSLGRDLGWAD